MINTLALQNSKRSTGLISKRKRRERNWFNSTLRYRNARDAIQWLARTTRRIMSVTNAHKSGVVLAHMKL